LVALGDPLGWDISYEHNFLKQQEYLAEINLPKYNSKKEYYFMDVFEHLILLMIIRREVIHFAIKNQMEHLIGAPEKQNDLSLLEESSESSSFLSRNSSMNDPDAIGSI